LKIGDFVVLTASDKDVKLRKTFKNAKGSYGRKNFKTNTWGKVIGIDTDFMKTYGTAKFIVALERTCGKKTGQFEEFTIEQKEWIKFKTMKGTEEISKRYNTFFRVQCLKDLEGDAEDSRAPEVVRILHESIKDHNTKKYDTDAKKNIQKNHLKGLKQLLEKKQKEVELPEIKRRRLVTMERLLKEIKRAERTA